MNSAIDTSSIISDLRNKNNEQILEEVLEDVENEESVRSTRPNLDDLDVYTKKLHVNDLAVKYEGMPIGKKDAYSIAYIRAINLLNSGLSPNILIDGKSQRGKSNTALEMAYRLHEDLNVLEGDFNPKDQVVYEVLPFLLFYRYNERVFCLFEEAGETLNKNDYNSDMNKAVASMIRTQGKKQIVNCFVTPEATELDPRIRDNIDIEIEMTGTGVGQITLYERKFSKKAEHDQRSFKFEKVNGKWNVPEAPKRIREPYNEIDSSYKGRYIDKQIMKVIQERKEEMEEEEFEQF